MQIDPSISSSELSNPRLLGTFRAYGDGVLCKMEVIVDILIEIRHGSGLLLHGVSWLVCEEDIPNVILGRQVLDEIGLDNRTLLAAAIDRLKGIIDVAPTNKDGTHDINNAVCTLRDSQ